VVTADVHRAIAGHLVVRVKNLADPNTHAALLIYDVADPTRPHLIDQGAVASGNRPRVRLAPGNRLLIPRGDAGVAVIDL
jgi:hypothetical protein